MFCLVALPVFVAVMIYYIFVFNVSIGSRYGRVADRDDDRVLTGHAAALPHQDMDVLVSVNVFH